jgi:hypothetical protein
MLHMPDTWLIHGYTPIMYIDGTLQFYKCQRRVDKGRGSSCVNQPLGPIILTQAQMEMVMSDSSCRKIIFELGICFRYSCSILFPCHGGSRTHITMSCSFLVLLSIAGVWNTVFFEGCRPFLDSKMARSLGAMSLKRPAEVDWIFDGNQVPPGDICRYKTVTFLKCAQFTHMWFRIAQFVFCWDNAELLGNCQGKASRALMTELKNLMKDGWQDLLGWFSLFLWLLVQKPKTERWSESRLVYDVYIYMFMVLSYHMNGIFFQSWPEQHQRVMISIPLSTMNPRIPGIISLGDKHASWIRSPGKVAYCHQRDRECGIPACSSTENMAGTPATCWDGRLFSSKL